MLKKYTPNTLNYSLQSKYIRDTISEMRYSFKDFREEYPDDDACLKAVMENRYGNTCPKCGVVGTKFYKITNRKAFACLHCRKHIYPLADTIFRKSETSLWNWFYAIFLFSTHKNGVSAKALERHLGVTYKTAWRMGQQIRLLMKQDTDVLSGTVEMDEAYMGGTKKNEPGKAGRNAVGKVPIFGMVERYGKIKVIAPPTLRSEVIKPFISKYVELGSTVYTDSFPMYKNLPTFGYKHSVIHHTKHEYVRGNVHTNTIENFWGQFKGSVRGTHHSISKKYMQNYVNEFVFRYNYRALAICPLLLERAAKLS